MLPVRSLTTGQDHSYNYLRQGILSGEFESGSRINMEHSAASLGLSRMPVRAAIRQLATEGVVTIYPRRGVRVTSLAPDHRVEPYLRFFLKLYDASEHRSLVKPIKGKNAGAAEYAMREHVRSAAAAILKFVPPAQTASSATSVTMQLRPVGRRGECQSA